MLQIISAARSYDAEDRSVVSYSTNLFYCIKCRAEIERTEQINTAGSYCLYYVLAGEMVIDNQVAKKGDMILFPRLSNVKVQIKEGAQWLCAMFDYSYEFSMIHKREYRLFYCTPVMREMAENLYSCHEYCSSLPGTKEAMLLVLLNEANRIAFSESKSIFIYEKALDWIDKNATRAISVEEVASVVGCTREHLNRVFRMASGKSVGTRIAMARIWEIEQLCRVETLSSGDIAKRLDFSSVELLCKFFRYHKGVSLSQYRLAHMGPS